MTGLLTDVRRLKCPLGFKKKRKKEMTVIDSRPQSLGKKKEKTRPDPSKTGGYVSAELFHSSVVS